MVDLNTDKGCLQLIKSVNGIDVANRPKLSIFFESISFHLNPTRSNEKTLKQTKEPTRSNTTTNRQVTYTRKTVQDLRNEVLKRSPQKNPKLTAQNPKLIAKPLQDLRNEVLKGSPQKNPKLTAQNPKLIAKPLQIAMQSMMKADFNQESQKSTKATKDKHAISKSAFTKENTQQPRVTSASPQRGVESDYPIF